MLSQRTLQTLSRVRKELELERAFCAAHSDTDGMTVMERITDTMDDIILSDLLKEKAGELLDNYTDKGCVEQKAE